LISRKTTLKFEYLREFEPEFKNVSGYELGTDLGSIHEKNQGPKISFYCTFKFMPTGSEAGSFTGVSQPSRGSQPPNNITYGPFLQVDRGKQEQKIFKKQVAQLKGKPTTHNTRPIW
jgi:hypothetical protein